MQKHIDESGQVYKGTKPVHDGKKIFVKNLKDKVKGDLQEVALEDMDQADDPYEVFGFGIIAYFSMMRYLMVAFALLTLAFMPTLYIYSQGKAFKGYVGTNSLNSYSLGNLG